MQCRAGTTARTRRVHSVNPEGAVAMGVPKIIDRKDYLVEVECHDSDTRHWKHPWCYKHNQGKGVVRPCIFNGDEQNTIHSLLDSSLKLRPNQQSVGVRPIKKEVREGKKIFWYKGDYQWSTFSELCADVRATAKGLLGLDQVMALKSAGKCSVGFLAETSAEWMVSAQACFKVGIPVSTVYTTLGHEAMVHGLTETECPVLFLDWIQFKFLDKPVLSKCPALVHIVLIGSCWVPEEVVGGEKVSFPNATEAEAIVKQCGAKVTTLDGLIAAGECSGTNVFDLAPKEDDLAIIMYTSGSTGVPKGVMLSNVNIVSALAGVWAQDVAISLPSDSCVGYLPCAHILELVGEISLLGRGASLGYGSPKTLSGASAYMAKDNPEGSDLMALKPTILIAVPMILDMITSGLLAKLEGMEGFKGKLVRAAVKQALGESGPDPVANALCSMGLKTRVLHKLKCGIGLENLRVLAAGGAPLAAETQRFVANVLAPVIQGYGCTETSGLSTAQEVFSRDGRPVDKSTGCVGPTTPAGEIKLRSVPDMGYLVTDTPPRGEILLGGAAVTQMGYFKNADKTQEDQPYHRDGRRWFHTGDIGCITESGAIMVIDRKKDLIKLSCGEYVSLGKVENALKQVRGIAACVVFARPDKDHTVAIISQPEKGWASVGGRPDEAKLVKAIGDGLRAQQLARFEIPTKVKVDDMIWTPEGGLITATLKLKRNPLRKHYNMPGGLLDELGYLFP